MIQEAIEKRYTSTGRHTGYQVRLYHPGLNEYKTLSASDFSILNEKIHNQKISFEKKWLAHQTRANKETKEQQALERTSAAKEQISESEKILMQGLSMKGGIDWETIKRQDIFRDGGSGLKGLISRREDGYPEKIVEAEYPPKPIKEQYLTGIPFFSLLFGQKEKVLNLYEVK
jgi:hypothetical protein